MAPDDHNFTKKYCHMTFHSLLLQVNAVLCVSIHISLLHTRWNILKKRNIGRPNYKITGYYQDLQLILTYSRVKTHIAISHIQSPLYHTYTALFIALYHFHSKS